MRCLSYDCDEVAAACTGAPVAGGRCGQVHGASRVRRDDRRPPGSRHQAVPSQLSPDTTSEKFLSSASSPAILQSAGTEIESLLDRTDEELFRSEIMYMQDQVQRNERLKK